MPANRRPLTANELRYRKQTRCGYALIASSAAAFAGMVALCAGLAPLAAVAAGAAFVIGLTGTIVAIVEGMNP